MEKFKYTCKRIIYYPKELYYKILRVNDNNKVYFVEFNHEKKDYRIMNDGPAISAQLPRILKDDIKIYAYFADMTITEVIVHCLEEFMKKQTLVDFVDCYKVLQKEDIASYASSRQIAEQEKLIKTIKNFEFRNDR